MYERLIRAVYDNETITVYQAFNKQIARSAIDNQTFVSPPFKKERMTWIKPSFLWMMYRSGWASKENQEHILAIKIKREGFEWALQNSCLSHFDPSVYRTHEIWKAKLQSSPVRIQWDPEKDIFLNPMTYKSIQIGLTAAAVDKYISEWILQIDDITEKCKIIHKLIINSQKNEAEASLPKEALYPLKENLRSIINATVSTY